MDWKNKQKESDIHTIHVKTKENYSKSLFQTFTQDHGKEFQLN